MIRTPKNPASLLDGLGQRWLDRDDYHASPLSIPSSPEFHPSQEDDRRLDREIVGNPHPDTWPDYPHLRVAHLEDIDPETGLPVPGLLHIDRLQSVLRASYEELLSRHVSQREIAERSVKYPSVDQLLKDWVVE